MRPSLLAEAGVRGSIRLREEIGGGADDEESVKPRVRKQGGSTRAQIEIRAAEINLEDLRVNPIVRHIQGNYPSGYQYLEDFKLGGSSRSKNTASKITNMCNALIEMGYNTGAWGGEEVYTLTMPELTSLHQVHMDNSSLMDSVKQLLEGKWLDTLNGMPLQTEEQKMEHEYAWAAYGQVKELATGIDEAAELYKLCVESDSHQSSLRWASDHYNHLYLRSVLMLERLDSWNDKKHYDQTETIKAFDKRYSRVLKEMQGNAMKQAMAEAAVKPVQAERPTAKLPQAAG